MQHPSAAVMRAVMACMRSPSAATWPVSRLVHPGSSAYCCLARLPDGRIGLLYERDDYRTLAFVAFELEWLTRGEEPPVQQDRPRPSAYTNGERQPPAPPNGRGSPFPFSLFTIRSSLPLRQVHLHHRYVHARLHDRQLQQHVTVALRELQL